MKQILRGVLVLLILASAGFAEVPRVNPPQAIRQQNWIGSARQGSCVHASMITLLKWQRKYQTAAWWREHCENGETWDNLVAKLPNVKWAGTIMNNDVSFLE